MLRFDPPPAQGRYAYYVGDNHYNGRMFIYDLLSSAKNAWYHKGRWTNDSVMKILEKVDGTWYTLFDIPVEAKKNTDLLPWKRETNSWRGSGKKSLPMTREEYAKWRLAVHEETSHNW